MKTLYLIGGPMGVGKTAAGQALKRLLPRSVYLDGDWCWDANPFIVTDETRAMVMDNITHLLGSFLRCTAYDHVIFVWVMHRQAILDELLADGVAMLAALLAVGNLSFWLCDRAVGALTRYYRLILRKKLKLLH